MIPYTLYFFICCVRFACKKICARRNTRINALPYHVSLSAVKNIHLAKSGIASIKHSNPAYKNNLSFRIINNAKSEIINSTSCIFILNTRYLILYTLYFSVVFNRLFEPFVNRHNRFPSEFFHCFCNIRLPSWRVIFRQWCVYNL